MSKAAASTELMVPEVPELTVSEVPGKSEVLFDPIAMMRQLLVHEVMSTRPSFALIKKYTDVLQATMAHKGELSVEDVGEPVRQANQGGHFTTVTNDIVIAGAGTGTLTMGGGGVAIQTPGHRRDVARDTQLGALEDIARRAGPDPLAALLSDWEVVQDLYPEDERDTLRARLRQAVEERLPTLSTTLVPTVQETPT